MSCRRPTLRSTACLENRRRSRLHRTHRKAWSSVALPICWNPRLTVIQTKGSRMRYHAASHLSCRRAEATNVSVGNTSRGGVRSHVRGERYLHVLQCGGCATSSRSETPLTAKDPDHRVTSYTVLTATCSDPYKVTGSCVACELYAY